MEKQILSSGHNESIKTIATLGFAMVFVFFLIGCLQKNTDAPDLSGPKYTLAFKLSNSQIILYKFEIEAKGQMAFNAKYPDKSRQYTDKINFEGVLEISKNIDGTLDTFFLPQSKGLSTLNTVSSSVQTGTSKGSNRTTAGLIDFAPVRQIFFPTPDFPVKVNEPWTIKIENQNGEKGFIRGVILGKEKRNGMECIKIRSEFDIITEKGRNSFRFNGSGISYFAPTEGIFTEGFCTFKLRTCYNAGGRNGFNDIYVEHSGDMKVTYEGRRIFDKK